MEDIDIWSGGISEIPIKGSILGPTFSCIIATQMSRARRGDRYWYEIPNQPSSFTPSKWFTNLELKNFLSLVLGL